jgi:hypothetical protein
MVIISRSPLNIMQDGLNTLVNVGRHQAGLMVNFQSASTLYGVVPAS